MAMNAGRCSMPATWECSQEVTDTPDAWVSRYLLNSYVKVDPIVKQGFERQLPFDWSEVEPTPEAYAMLVDAQKHGIGGNGYSIPVADKAQRRALLSMNARIPADAVIGYFNKQFAV